MIRKETETIGVLIPEFNKKGQLFPLTMPFQIETARTPE